MSPNFVFKTKINANAKSPDKTALTIFIKFNYALNMLKNTKYFKILCFRKI